LTAHQQHALQKRITELEGLLQTANYEVKLAKERLAQQQYWTTLNEASKLQHLQTLSAANSRVRYKEGEEL
jgi:hypothetical protein